MTQLDPQIDLPAGRSAFVLHDHLKPQHHFDLRLERGGVLESWALPKGLPTEPTRNRLAVGVPDHDLEHLTYTDEHKSIADIGWWEEHDRNERRFVFTLHGRTGAARYALIRTSERDWLLHLTKEQPVNEESVNGNPASGLADEIGEQTETAPNRPVSRGRDGGSS